jgi:exonuclease SbcC
MRLVSLTLDNLRSYVREEVRFGDGVNLFEGDIGSGKSTILLAIEFALFGLAEVASRSLLRHGAKEGGVELVLEVRGRRVRAVRRLRRTKDGAQVRGCLVEVDGKETKLSSKEMRQRVLELLEYGERRNPRAKLDIYRYSIYTPQEDMRTVLLTDKDSLSKRKDTLRRALDLDEYRQMVTNLHELRREVNRDADRLEGMAMDIDEARTHLEQATGELEAIRVERTRAIEDREEAVAKARSLGEGLEDLETRERSYQEALTRSKDTENVLARAEGMSRELTALLDAARREEGELAEVRRRLEEHEDALEELGELQAVAARVDELRRDHQGAAADLERLRAELGTATKAAGTAETLASRLGDLEDPGARIETTRKDMDRIKDELARIHHGNDRLGEDIEDLRAESEELSTLEGEATCPKCRQPLSEEHLERLLADNKRKRNRLSSKRKEAGAKANRLAEEAEEAQRSLAELEGSAQERRDMERDLALATKEASRLEDLQARVEAHPASVIERELGTLEGSLDRDRLRELLQLKGVVQELRAAEERLGTSVKGIPELERSLEEARAAFEEAKVDRERGLEDLRSLEKEWDRGALEEARREHREALQAMEAQRARLTTIEDRMEALEAKVAERRERVAKLEGLVDRRAVHLHVATWLEDRLIPAVEAMERSVMSLLADEMDQAASQWFGQLVDDPDLVLSIDEDFVPTVTQQDYEMDLGALSGGERTAAAFAYRLALNGLVRSNATPDQRNLLVLDEPTDGFSREQLGRMGGVFAELDADQVVIVSHDRELRAFANRVYLVQKVGGSSRVTEVK